MKKKKKHRLWRRWTWKKAKPAEEKPSEATECCLQQEKATGKGSLAGEVTTPNNAPTESPLVLLYPLIHLPSQLILSRTHDF